VFQTCKDSYSPFQNSELAELLIKIADKGGYEIHKGGYFKGGAKVYVQLLSGNQLNGIGKNKTTVVGYTTGLNSHDGSTSLKWGSTNTTICCQNTFNAVSRQLSSIVRHTPKMLDRVDAYLTEIEVAIKQEKAIFNSFVRFSEIPMERHQLVKSVKEVTGVDFTLSRQEQEEKFSTYSINKAHDLLDCIGIETAQKGETLWGLFSGVTNYTTHRMPVGNRDNARLESKYVGTGAMIDNRVFDLVSSFN